MSINNSKPESRKKDIVVQELEDEVLVYDLLKNKAFCLNKTSAVIWQNCNGERLIEEIAEVSGRKLNADINAEMVWLALEQFKKDSLLEEYTSSDALFNGMSRREVIRKVSIGSLIALPIVSSLVAPMAVHAGSATCMGSCQCPNATVTFCSPTGVGGTLQCQTLTPTCRCRGPFGADGGGTSPGQKTGSCS
ncbi:MAG: hypothetical protein ACR2J3_13545 [Aridibacter sp.]